MLTGIIDFCQFVPLSLTLTGHKVSGKQNLLPFLAHFSADQDEIWYGVEAIQI